MGSKAKVVGAGVVAAAAAAGVYFLYGRDGAKNRKMIKGWVLKMKGDILEKMEDLKEINADVYHRLVDQVGEHYLKLKKVNSAELRQLIKELKGFWDEASFEGGNGNGKETVKQRLKRKV